MTPGSDLLLFPASLPDEALVSRASRYHILTRNRKTRDSFMQLFGKPRTALTDIVPPDIPSLALCQTQSQVDTASDANAI